MQKKFTLFFALLFVGTMLFSQTQTQVYLSQSITGASCKGFYQCLPPNYNADIKNYPLIIWVHGAGQVGEGNIADLPKVLEWGVPKIISEGGFPASFSVGDSSFSFIVISPQFTGWPSGGNVGAILTYAMSNYRVDPTRVYLMGISAGGGAAWEFASLNITNSNKIAAMIPFCGAFAPTQTLANRIAAANLPVWAFHNTNDGTVPVAYSRNWKTYINNYTPTPNPQTKLTEFPLISSDAIIAHECWSQATLPGYKPEGINIYEWMLGYRQRTVNVNLPPLAAAGQDIGVVLPANAIMDGSSSVDQDGIIVAYKWRKVNGPSSYTFSDSVAVSPVISNLTEGVYQFELTVTDNMGAVSKDSLTVNVYHSLPAGAQQRILIDVGGNANFGGTITSSPNINGNTWNNMTDARAGVNVSNALTIANQLSGIAVEVINRVDGTYNSASSPGTGNGNTTGVVGDYPASATTDHALIHSSATNGKWRIKGLQANKIYTIKFWGSRTNTTAARSAEIKRTDDNIWKTYNATSNSNFNNAAVFVVTGKTVMDFDIRTKAGSDFSCINVLDIFYGSDTTIATVNLPPIARAGADTSLQLPTDSLTIRGCASSDPENGILKYKWKKIAGPASFQIINDTLCATKIKNLVAGNYIFELAVTDTAGLTAKDSVNIVVLPYFSFAWPPQVTPLCNRAYKIVIVGSSTAYGTGANPIDSSWAKKFTSYLLLQNPQIQVINIATPGLTSYDVSATGTIIPAPFSVDTMRNITKALSLNPDAIILNLPSNDVARGIPTNNIHQNFINITTLANNQNIPVWVSTTQPRDGLSPSENILQMDLRDWINTTYGNKAVDFWTGIANADGTINSFYSAGDGVHLNNYGHHILFTRMAAEKIGDTICIRNNIPANILPIANAGADINITLPINTAALTGSGTDADGTIASYNWVKISGPATGTLANATAATATASGLLQGIYAYQLTLTDNVGGIAKDTVLVTVHIGIPPANILPIANAGSDISITLPVNTTTLTGSGTDADGTIASYNWVKISGPATGTLANATTATATASGLLQGIYAYQLTVTDNVGGIAKDTVLVTVNAQVQVAKKINVNIYGGSNPYNIAQWNNWNMSAGLSSSIFYYDDGSASSINAVITASGLISDNGSAYATTATVCPTQVLRYNSANTSYRTLTLNGLDPAIKYNLEFYASRGNTGNSSIYQIGTLLDTISTDNNINDFAKFINISPNSAGKILVTISRIGTWNYIAGFIIKEASINPPPLLARTNKTAADASDENIAEKTKQNNELLLYPNPAGDVVTVKLPPALENEYLVTITNEMGSTVYRKVHHKKNEVTPNLIDIKNLKQGLYILQLQTKMQHISYKFLKW